MTPMTSQPKHEHPGGEVPHRHNDDDELGTHGSSDPRITDDQRLQLREEELQARKESVETGRVRIGKEVVEEQQTLEVPVTREEVIVERHPVERRPAQRSIDESNETVQVPVHEEQVQVDKRAVVTEQINIGKRQVQETERVSDTVRREEARIEHDGDIDVEDKR